MVNVQRGSNFRMLSNNWDVYSIAVPGRLRDLCGREGKRIGRARGWMTPRELWQTLLADAETMAAHGRPAEAPPRQTEDLRKLRPDRRPAEAPPRQRGEGKVGMKPCPNHGAFDHCWIRESQFIEVTVDVFPMLQSGHYTQEESASKKQTPWFFLLLCFAF